MTTKKNKEPTFELVAFRARKNPIEVQVRQTDKVIYIDTLEGRMRADPGDFIVTGVKGEHYPVKPEIFEKTYTRIKD